MKRRGVSRRARQTQADTGTNLVEERVVLERAKGGHRERLRGGEHRVVGRGRTRGLRELRRVVASVLLRGDGEDGLERREH